MRGLFGQFGDDVETLDAKSLVEAVNEGMTQEAVAALQKMDLSARNAVCVQARALLALPVCSTGNEPSGTCINADMLKAPPATVRDNLAAVCKQAGATAGTGEILGLKATTFYVVAGVAAVGVGLLLLLPKKK